MSFIDIDQKAVILNFNDFKETNLVKARASLSNCALSPGVKI